MSAGVNTRVSPEARAVQARRGAGWLARQGLLYAALLVGAFVSLFPFYYMFMASTLAKSEVLAQPPRLLPGGYLFDNLGRLLNDTSLELGEGIRNSVIIALISTVLTVMISSMAGYAFAKYR